MSLSTKELENIIETNPKREAEIRYQGLREDEYETSDYLILSNLKGAIVA